MKKGMKPKPKGPAGPNVKGGPALNAAGQKAAIPNGVKVGKGARKGKLLGGY